MALSVTCGCGKKLSIKSELAGRRVKCPQCGATLTAPEAGAAPPPVPAAPRAKPAGGISTGLAALLMAVLGTVLFFVGGRGLGTNSDVGMIMWAAGGVIWLVSLVLGLIGAAKDSGRVLGVVAVFVVIAAAIASEMR